MKQFNKHVELKLNRAESQARALAKSVSDWVASEPLIFESELREGRLGCRLTLTGFREQPPFEEWGLAFGECIHNLRSALDNLAYALARLKLDPPQRPNRISFPIFENEAEFIKRGRKDIGQLPEAAASLIERLQPFHRDGSPEKGTVDQDLLSRLSWFNNVDKHRVPSVAAIAPQVLKHNVEIKYYSEEDAIANEPPDCSVGSGLLEPGLTLVEIRTNCPIESIEGKMNVEAIVSVQYKDRYEPIGAVLQAMYIYTSIVIAQFDAFFEQEDPQI